MMLPNRRLLFTKLIFTKLPDTVFTRIFRCKFDCTKCEQKQPLNNRWNLVQSLEFEFFPRSIASVQPSKRLSLHSFIPCPVLTYACSGIECLKSASTGTSVAANRISAYRRVRITHLQAAFVSV